MSCVIKSCGHADYHVGWFAHVHPAFVPRNVRWRSVDSYSYTFVDGVHPTSWRLVRDAAKRALWERTPRMPINPKKYMDYVASRFSVLDVDLVVPFIKLMCNTITKDTLTPVGMCHGDLTFCNVLVNDGQVVFIDPGLHRGLPCRELDEAKMLQSILGWDVVRHGHAPANDFPLFEVRPVHWALLATHLVRLLHHEHPARALNWARDTLGRILQFADTCVPDPADSNPHSVAERIAVHLSRQQGKKAAQNEAKNRIC